jgi:hypothetical protein
MALFGGCDRNLSGHREKDDFFALVFCAFLGNLCFDLMKTIDFCLDILSTSILGLSVFSLDSAQSLPE